MNSRWSQARIPSLDLDHERSKYQEGDPPRPDPNDAALVISPDVLRSQRMPPGQSRTRKWPVLDAFGPPVIDLQRWSLEFFGLVEEPLTLSLAEFADLPRVKVFADMHCVTRWSRLGNTWEGVSMGEIGRRLVLKPGATHALMRAYDGNWTTNLPVEALFQEDVLLADRHDGRTISLEHGGPVRLVVPRLYAWKSAKWIRSIEFRRGDTPGFWEKGGYHMNGDPWAEERFGGRD